MSAFTFGDHEKRGPARHVNWHERIAAKRERGRIERARCQAAEDELVTLALAWGRPFAILDLVKPGQAQMHAHSILARLERNGKVERAGTRGQAQLWRMVGMVTPAVEQTPKAQDDLGTPNAVELAWTAEKATMKFKPDPNIMQGVSARAEMAENFK